MFIRRPTTGVLGITFLMAGSAARSPPFTPCGPPTCWREHRRQNDVLGNLAVMLAALGVFGTGAGWPDIIVATVMAALALRGCAIVARDALAELRRAGAVIL